MSEMVTEYTFTGNCTLFVDQYGVKRVKETALDAEYHRKLGVKQRGYK